MFGADAFCNPASGNQDRDRLPIALIFRWELHFLSAAENFVS